MYYIQFDTLATVDLEANSNDHQINMNPFHFSGQINEKLDGMGQSFFSLHGTFVLTVDPTRVQR